MDDVVLAFPDQPPSGGAEAREYGGRCKMHPRQGTRRIRLHLAATVGVFLLSACTGGTAAEPSPTRDSSPPAVVPTESPTPSETATVALTSDVEVAYQHYLDTTVAAMETGDPTRIEAATGQALAAAQARVAALSSQDRVAKGAFRSAIESLDVDGDKAELRDCYAADVTEHDRETDEQVADRDGTRFWADVRLERADDGWTVVEFNQGEFCVPDDLAEEIEGGYLAFWTAVSTAGRPPNPDHPDLAATAAGEQLEGLRERISGFREDGYEIRDETVSHPVATRISQSDTVAIVHDCRDLDPDGGIYDAETGELVHGGAEPEQRDLWETRLQVIDGAWKVVDADLVEEDSGCEPAAS